MASLKKTAQQAHLAAVRAKRQAEIDAKQAAYEFEQREIQQERHNQIMRGQIALNRANPLAKAINQATGLLVPH